MRHAAMTTASKASVFGIEQRISGDIPIRCDHRPTSCGCEEVHALGSMVSSVLVKPCTMLYPETLAVIDPSVDAARAVVDRCPMDTTEAMTSEYSSRCVLTCYETVSVKRERFVRA